MGVWQEELHKWFGLTSIIYTGTPAKRKKVLEEYLQHEGFLITTYAMAKELGYRWDGVFVDEYHTSGLMNHKSKFYKTMEQLSPNCWRLYLLTGTPIRQGVIDLYAPLHLLHPEHFRNYWQFVSRHCVTTQTPFGKCIERTPARVHEFRSMLKSYMIRRLKTEVLQDLPGKQRNVVPLVMTPKQLRAYRALEKEMLYIDESCVDADVIAPNQMVTDLRLRQLLVSPRLLGIDDDGSALAYLTEVVPELLEACKPVVIFTPFRQAVDIIKDVICGWGTNTTVFTLQGGMHPNDFAASWQGFRAYENNKILICVIKSGASFHATCAADCFFLGYEWDFNFNVQAEDRLCRIGQNNFVQCNYLLHTEDTVDTHVKNRLNEKNLAANWCIGTDKQIRDLINANRRRSI